MSDDILRLLTGGPNGGIQHNGGIPMLGGLQQPSLPMYGTFLQAAKKYRFRIEGKWNEYTVVEAIGAVLPNSSAPGLLLIPSVIVCKDSDDEQHLFNWSAITEYKLAEEVSK